MAKVTQIKRYTKTKNTTTKPSGSKKSVKRRRRR